jgi:hypothetical protein
MNTSRRIGPVNDVICSLAMGVSFLSPAVGAAATEPSSSKKSRVAAAASGARSRCPPTTFPTPISRRSSNGFLRSNRSVGLGGWRLSAGSQNRLAGICKTPPMRPGILSRHDGRSAPRRAAAMLVSAPEIALSRRRDTATQGYIVAAGDIAEFLRRLLPRTVLLLRDLFGPPRRAAQAARRFFELCSSYRKSSG